MWPFTILKHLPESEFQMLPYSLVFRVNLNCEGNPWIGRLRLAGLHSMQLHVYCLPLSGLQIQNQRILWKKPHRENISKRGQLSFLRLYLITTFQLRFQMWSRRSTSGSGNTSFPPVSQLQHRWVTGSALSAAGGGDAVGGSELSRFGFSFF